MDLPDNVSQIVDSAWVRFNDPSFSDSVAGQTGNLIAIYDVPIRMRRVTVIAIVSLILAACSSAGSDPTTTSAVGVPSPDAAPTSTSMLSDEPAQPPPTESTSSNNAVTDGGEAYEWTVIAVEFDDVLNVRRRPDAGSPVVATLDPWSNNFVASLDYTETDGGRWRQVVTNDGAVGYVNARFIVAQPHDATTADVAELASLTEDAVRWATTGAGSAPDEWLAGTGLWVGGIGVFADGHNGWEWLPRADIDQQAEWLEVRTFEIPAVGESECGSWCDITLDEYVGFDRLNETASYLVDDIADENSRGFLDGELWRASESLHRVVIGQPSTEGIDAEGNPMINLDFLRIHVVFDWSDGEPRIALIQRWGWTP